MPGLKASKPRLRATGATFCEVEWDVQTGDWLRKRTQNVYKITQRTDGLETVTEETRENTFRFNGLQPGHH